MNRSITLLYAAVFALTLNSAFAAEDLAEAEKKMRASLAVLLPTLTPDTITKAPVPDLYEVTFGTRVVYLTGDGRYLLQGKIIDLETRTPITEQRIKELKKVALDGLDESQMIVFGDDQAKHTITVFTDIDCGYCRKLHSEMDDYNKNGIRVRYLAYPRAGLQSSSARDAVSVWCADDRNEAMTIAKQGGKLAQRDCENPVAEHYQLGQVFGISGTPALILDDGEIIPGYIPAAKLRAALDQR